jgi:hypothetical protein
MYPEVFDPESSFDPESNEWLEGYGNQRAAWEQQNADARAVAVHEGGRPLGRGHVFVP